MVASRRGTAARRDRCDGQPSGSGLCSVGRPIRPAHWYRAAVDRPGERCRPGGWRCRGRRVGEVRMVAQPKSLPGVRVPAVELMFRVGSTREGTAA